MSAPPCYTRTRIIPAAKVRSLCLDRYSTSTYRYWYWRPFDKAMIQCKYRPTAAAVLPVVRRTPAVQYEPAPAQVRSMSTSTRTVLYSYRYCMQPSCYCWCVCQTFVPERCRVTFRCRVTGRSAACSRIRIKLGSGEPLQAELEE